MHKLSFSLYFHSFNLSLEVSTTLDPLNHMGTKAEQYDDITIVFCSGLQLLISGHTRGHIHTETATEGVKGIQDLKHTHEHTSLSIGMAWDLAPVAVKIAYRQLPWPCALLQSLGRASIQISPSRIRL